MGQGRVQLGQFQAPLGSGVKVPAGGGFVKEPFSFAVVIWAVDSLSSVVVPGRPSPGLLRLTLKMNAIQQAAVQPIRLRVSYVIAALRPMAGHGAEGDRREPRPGRSGCNQGPRSTSRSAPRAPLRVPGRPELRPQPAGVLAADIPYLNPDHHRAPSRTGRIPGDLEESRAEEEHYPGIIRGTELPAAYQRSVAQPGRSRRTCCRPPPILPARPATRP